MRKTYLKNIKSIIILIIICLIIISSFSCKSISLESRLEANINASIDKKLSPENIFSQFAKRYVKYMIVDVFQNKDIRDNIISLVFSRYKAEVTLKSVLDQVIDKKATPQNSVLEISDDLSSAFLSKIHEDVFKIMSKGYIRYSQTFAYIVGKIENWNSAQIDAFARLLLFVPQYTMAYAENDSNEKKDVLSYIKNEISGSKFLNLEYDNFSEDFNLNLKLKYYNESNNEKVDKNIVDNDKYSSNSIKMAFENIWLASAISKNDNKLWGKILLDIIISNGKNANVDFSAILSQLLYQVYFRDIIKLIKLTSNDIFIEFCGKSELDNNKDKKTNINADVKDFYYKNGFYTIFYNIFIDTIINNRAEDYLSVISAKESNGIILYKLFFKIISVMLSTENESNIYFKSGKLIKDIDAELDNLNSEQLYQYLRYLGQNLVIFLVSDVSDLNKENLKKMLYKKEYDKDTDDNYIYIKYLRDDARIIFNILDINYKDSDYNELEKIDMDEVIEKIQNNSILWLSSNKWDYVVNSTSRATKSCVSPDCYSCLKFENVQQTSLYFGIAVAVIGGFIYFDDVVLGDKVFKSDKILDVNKKDISGIAFTSAGFSFSFYGINYLVNESSFEAKHQTVENSLSVQMFKPYQLVMEYENLYEGKDNRNKSYNEMQKLLKIDVDKIFSDLIVTKDKLKREIEKLSDDIKSLVATVQKAKKQIDEINKKLGEILGVSDENSISVDASVDISGINTVSPSTMLYSEQTKLYNSLDNIDKKIDLLYKVAYTADSTQNPQEKRKLSLKNVQQIIQDVYKELNDLKLEIKNITGNIGEGKKPNINKQAPSFDSTELTTNIIDKIERKEGKLEKLINNLASIEELQRENLVSILDKIDEKEQGVKSVIKLQLTSTKDKQAKTSVPGSLVIKDDPIARCFIAVQDYESKNNKKAYCVVIRTCVDKDDNLELLSLSKYKQKTYDLILNNLLSNNKYKIGNKYKKINVTTSLNIGIAENNSKQICIEYLIIFDNVPFDSILYMEIDFGTYIEILNKIHKENVNEINDVSAKNYQQMLNDKLDKINDTLVDTTWEIKTFREKDFKSYIE